MSSRREGYSTPAESALPEEPRHLGIAACREWDEESWLHSGVTVDYYLGKATPGARRRTGIGVGLTFSPASEPFLHPGKSALVADRGGRRLG